MLIAVLLFVLGVSVELSESLTLSPCGTDTTVELIETSGDNTVTCSGIPSSDYTVEWLLTLPKRSLSVGTCTADGSQCTNWSFIGYVATRPTTDVSVMTIDPLVQPNFVRNGTLSCRASKVGQAAQTTSCQMDIVSPPSSVTCQPLQPVTSTSPWTVVGRCEVTKVYSYRGSYSCQWYSKQGASTQTWIGQPVTMQTTHTTDVTPTGGIYVNGVCNATMPLPSIDDVYNHTVVISPGGVSHDAGGLVIRKPSARHNCPQYASEGQPLTCTCAGDAGRPPGVFSWADNSGSATLTAANVSRTKHGAQYGCQAIWNGAVVQSVYYTLNVAYGPDRVSATVPDTFDTNGSLNLTLSCSASDVNPPSPTFTWTRPPSSLVIHQGQNYTFKPQPPTDDGSVFLCRAQNAVSNVNRTAAVTVHLNYPPITNPVITTNSTDGNLYQGDTVALTCTVTGGKPLNVTSVTLTCYGKQSTVGSNGVTGSVTFNPVLDSDHNSQCTCNTSWKQTDWYTQSIQTTLFVNTPPSTPSITVTGGDYPPIAGVTVGVTFTCVSSTPGRPAAKYTWPVAGGGQPGVDSQGRGTLTFGTFSREDDRKDFTCRASNPFTVNKQIVAESSFILQVHYHPVITFLAHQDNACLLTAATTCEVLEGQRVNILCSAVSNPAPAVVTWRKDGGTYTASSNFNIASVNHTIHNGKYNCTVTTGNLGIGRQPLTSSQELTVLVKQGLQEPAGGAVGLDVGAAVAVSVVVTFVVVVVVVVVWMWRRRLILLPCVDAGSGSTTNGRSTVVGANTDLDLSEISDTTAKQQSADNTGDMSVYDGLKTDEVGQPSTYSSLRLNNVNGGTAGSGPLYQNVSRKNTRTYANMDGGTAR